MDVKEKLVELIAKAKEIYAGDYTDHTEDEYIAEMLLDNGVTVQEWIPASEPPKDDLPVLVTCGKGYRPFVARYDLVWKRWRVSHTLKITHWQPLPSTRDLPQPPKGETIYCKDCENLMFSDCYGECAKGHKGIVNPNDTCEHAKRKPPKGE